MIYSTALLLFDMSVTAVKLVSGWLHDVYSDAVTFLGTINQLPF